jgi:hypothetical protein
MGHRTFTSVPDFAFKDRDIIEIHASDRPADALARFPNRVLFIAGGPAVHATHARFIRDWDINRLPYDREADRLRSCLAGRGRSSGLAPRFVDRPPNESAWSNSVFELTFQDQAPENCCFANKVVN